MRILLYSCTAWPKLGGQEAVVDSLARQFAVLGHEPFVMAPRPKHFRPDDRSLPYPVLRHPRFISTKHLVSWYRRWLLRAYQRFNFDILHCHDVYPTGYLAALLRDRLNCPILITSHGGDLREGNVRLSKPGMQPRFEMAVRAADRLVVISGFTHRGFLRLGARENQIVDIPNGVEIAPLQTRVERPCKLHPAIEAGRYFLFMGRLTRQKGVDVLLRAIALLPRARGVQVVIAGDGDEQVALQKLAEALGLGQSVEFVGRVSGALKNYLFQNALATVVPSRTWEAFGLVVVESYAAGRPVIASRHLGLADLVNDGVTGRLVAPESAEELAGAMQELLAAPQSADGMGENARRAAAAYSLQEVAARHLALYEELRRGTKRDKTIAPAARFARV
jgi:glycosyltransferase involved in cell wall biosynthesis